jgi:hypothetical protein
MNGDLGSLTAVVAEDLSRPTNDEALTPAVARLVAASEGSVVAVIFFGSRSSGAGANPHSAHDLFVIVDDYRRFYETLRARSLVRRSPILLSALNRLLPPNQLSVRFAELGFHGKCAVITLGHFLRETSSRRRDHFCQGRLFQPVSLVYAASDEFRDAVLRSLTSVRLQTMAWSAPYLPPTFDVEQYCLRLLEVSLAAEVRPESSARALRLAKAQQARQHPVYGEALELQATRGVLRASGDEGEQREYSLVKSPSALTRLRLRLYFAVSLVRATARWAKHVVTFEDWLEYIVRKVERHSGEVVELTPRERRFPLIFLWPRFLRHMMAKNSGRRR